MALLLVMVGDPDAPTAPARGDVIVAMPDGHQFGAREVGNPNWRVLSVPGEPVETFAHLVASGKPTNKADGEAGRHTYRAFHLDLDKPRVAKGLRAHFGDEGREAPAHRTTAKALLAMAKPHDPLTADDDSTIG